MSKAPAPDSKPVDLDRCAAEPIRIPGSIQPHGALLVVEPATWRILQASANSTEILDFAFDPEAGHRFDDLPFANPALKAEIAAWSAGETPLHLRTIQSSGGARQLLCHRSAQGLILELEEAPVSE